MVGKVQFSVEGEKLEYFVIGGGSVKNAMVKGYLLQKPNGDIWQTDTWLAVYSHLYIFLYLIAK